MSLLWDKAPFTDIDVYIWRIHVKHYDGNEILTSADRVETDRAVFINNGEALHVDVIDPKIGIDFSIHKQMIPPLFWVIYFAVILTASILITLLVERLSKRCLILPRVLMEISCIIVALLAGMFFCGSSPYSGFKYFSLNWLFLYALNLVIGAITLPWIGTAAEVMGGYVFKQTWQMILGVVVVVLYAVGIVITRSADKHPKAWDVVLQNRGV